MPQDINLTDEQLAKAALANLEVFGQLVERYETKLKFYILRISHFSDLEAEEILQDVFVKAWKNLNGFDEDLKFSTWIYRITHNETISAFRKAKSRGDTERADLEPALFDSLADDTNFVEALDQNIDAQEVRTILDTLPDNYREVLILRFIEDKSYAEIGDIIMKPGGTVATLLNRAKAQFKQNYLQQFSSHL